MDAECALTLPISHFKKVVYYTSVIELGIASLMMSHDQSFKIYMIRMWKKTIFLSQFICRRNYKIIYSTLYFYFR